MLSAKAYKARSRKVIDLPSGGQVLVRRLQAQDWVAVFEGLPSVFAERSEEEIRKHLENSPKENRKALVLFLTRGVVSMKVVDKPPMDCGEDEVSVDEFSDEDINAVASAIGELSRIKKEDADQIRPFPETLGSTGMDDSCAGEGVRDASQPDSGT